MYQEVVTDKRICLVSKAHPPLKKLKLMGFMGPVSRNAWDIKIAFVGKYSERSGTKLKTLKAWGTKLNDESMVVIGNRCPDLQFLNIGHCEDVTRDGVKEVVRKCKELRVLNVRGCPNVGIGILDWMVISRPPIALKEVFSPCGFPPPSEDMRNLFLCFGCRLT
ncbi:hypothetical protein RHSIM_Rhsim01G0031400 [Rhododendron simsii]|uniref:Uncharacterized protein n=1 Tax=Rhododendron simsii TaxID=118357 RepID=A0A834HI49_RHOSS|nr:hypothetical protein RHSIM_Rhsim01G0031400 [Rhododendron simsii]